MMDCVAVGATSKPEMEEGFSEPKARALEKLVQTGCRKRFEVDTHSAAI